MAQTEIAGHPWPAEVEIPVRHSQIFVVRLGIDREGEIVCAIQNVQGAWNDFDVPGLKLWILRAGHTRRDPATDLNHIFATQCMRLLRKVGVFFRAKDNLRQPFAIAQIDENDAAVIARNIYPAGERDLPADIAFAKRITIVCAIHVQAELETLKNFATLSSKASCAISDSSRVAIFFTFTSGHSSP